MKNVITKLDIKFNDFINNASITELEIISTFIKSQIKTDLPLKKSVELKPLCPEFEKKIIDFSIEDLIIVKDFLSKEMKQYSTSNKNKKL